MRRGGAAAQQYYILCARGEAGRGGGGTDAAESSSAFFALAVRASRTRTQPQLQQKTLPPPSPTHLLLALAVARAREALSLPDAISLAETLTGSARTAKLSAYIFAARTILSMCTAIGRRDCSAGYAALGAAAQHSISALHPGACAFVLLSHFYSFSSQI